MNRVFLDANVVLDYLLAREPWDAEAAPLWANLADGTLTACISANTVLNVAYVARKEFDVRRMRVALLGMMELLEVVAVEEETLRAALASALTDFEDAVQHECALVCGAEAIITRDVKGFLGSRLPVFTPTDFIHRHVVTT